MKGLERIYRLLLKLYPARFREEYAGSLERQFQDEYREASGRGDKALLWLRALADLATSIPAQIAREVRQDLGYAVRVYRQRKLVTGLALGALALAIGATTGVFSVLNALLLRGLPFRDAERLVVVQESPVDDAKGRPVFYDWRDHSAYLQDAAAFLTWEANLSLPRASARAKVCETSSNFFAVLGVAPALGRAFGADEDVPGRAGVAVIGYGLWRRLFGGDPRALGSTVRLNDAPLTVVGIAPPGFDYPGNTDVWTPTAFDRRRLPGAGKFGGNVIGRLKPGLPMVQAGALFEADVRRLNPRSLEGNPRDTPHLIPLREELAGPVGRASLVLMGAVVFVLLIACANVAHLLLSRTAERRQELTMRAALGASRARLVQQLVTESMALTLAAAAAGLVVAHWAARIATLARPVQLSALAAPTARLSAQSYAILDWRVLAFTVGVAALTGVLFGVLPARLMGRMLVAGDAMRLQPGSHGSGAGRMRSALIAAQAASTVVLLAGSLSMGRSFLKLVGADLGFRTERVVTLNASLNGARYTSDAARKRYYSDALERLRAIPGVESAGAVGSLPLIFNAASISARFHIDAAHQVSGSAVPASPGYFRAIGTSVVEGREFTDADLESSEPVAIVNEALARELGAKSGLAGRKVFSFWGKKEFTVVGVVRTERSVGPSRPGGPRLYYLLDRQAWPFVTFAARTRGRPEPYLALCRNAVQQADPQIPVYDVKTLDQRLDDLLAGSRFYMAAVLFFAALALLLAVIGVYGVAAHSVAQRTHEIGVRIAVGAAPREVRLMLLRQSLLPVAAGMLAGGVAAAGLGRFIRHVMENAQPVGAGTCGAAALALMAAAAMAVWSATRRVSRMDPMSALRAE